MKYLAHHKIVFVESKEPADKELSMPTQGSSQLLLKASKKMFNNLHIFDKTAQLDNLTPQILKISAANVSNQATLKFISLLQSGAILDAIFEKKLPGKKAVLSLEGHKITVEIPKDLSNERLNDPKNLSPGSLIKGQRMIVRVENPGSKPSLKILSYPSVENDKVTTHLTQRGKSISNFLNFHGNSQRSTLSTSKPVMTETVNKVFTMPVETQESVKFGSSINLERTARGKASVLSDAAPNITKMVDFDSLKPYLPARMPLGKMVYLLKNEVLESPLIKDLGVKSDLVVRLRETLALLLPDEGDIPDATGIRRQVEASGVNYEAKIRQVLESPSDVLARKELAGNLKGLLLELNQNIEHIPSKSLQKAPDPFADIRNIIKYAIDNIELNQLSSQISKQENQPLVIQIPNPLSSGNKTIELFVRDDNSEKNSNDKNQKRNHNVAFFLDLSFLGKIKINAQMDQDHLSVSIDVENETVADFINNRTEDFTCEMSEINMDTTVECKVTQKINPLKDNLIDLLVSKNTSLVNLKT